MIGNIPQRQFLDTRESEVSPKANSLFTFHRYFSPKII
jgi:hypothetical protein